MKRLVLLAILDGWGIGVDEPGNAILGASTPVMDRLLATFPNSRLITSGRAVGLPDGQMGNSEVGHLNLGAGFVVYQWITRIDQAIDDGSFAANAGLIEGIDAAVSRRSTLHVMGLIGDGGVHAHSRHLKAILDLAKRRGARNVLVHAFTDGRDTSPTSGAAHVADIEDHVRSLGIGRIASVSGRYYAMDRDHRWERTRQAFDAIAHGQGPAAASAGDTVRASYAGGITDEFIVPTVIPAADGSRHRIADGDAIIVFNFRSDRARQLTEALAVPAFATFDRGCYRVASPIVTLTTYESTLPVTVAFPPHDVVHPVARVVSEAGMTQFHTAETEKYPHVTFFYNGGREEPFAGEERRLVPSPKVATYDLQPEMSAPEVCDGVVAAIESGCYDFILVNFANADMVGHTGVYDAVVRAVETVDTCVGRIVESLSRHGGTGIITADHGNAERLIDPVTGGPMTAHTTNPVPVVLVAPEDSPLRRVALRSDQVLSSIGTTVIDLLGLPVPADMTSPSIIVR